MPLFADSLKGKGEKGELNWQGEVLHFTYNPNAISHKERRELRRMIGTAEGEESPETDWIVIYLTKMLVSWDIYATKADLQAKHSLPINAATIDSLPDPLLLALMTRIGELMSPPAPPSGSDGSFTAPGETLGGNARIGTSTF